MQEGVEMKIIKTQDYVKMENPNPGKPYRPEILTRDDQAKALGGMFGLLVPGSQVPYHYHKERESVIIAISGEATEVVEGKEYPFRAGEVFYIQAGEKHMTVNRSGEDFRYLEFFTCPPVSADFVEVK
jgi:quercetin dioxygenase-like cupin family protein